MFSPKLYEKSHKTFQKCPKYSKIKIKEGDVMKILIICSASFYKQIAPIKKQLENKNFQIIMPSTYETPNVEKQAWKKGHKAHALLVQELFKISEEKIKTVDAVLCINMKKHNIENYIGGATFIELYEAFKNNKKIYLYNDIPKGILYDEISSFEPIVINKNLDLIK